MGKVVVINHITLDGVMQAPARSDEDTRGGFAHGGWAMPGQDGVMGMFLSAGLDPDSALLLGRWTYEDLAGYWPYESTENPYTGVINAQRKYVASRTLREPLTWNNSVLIDGDVASTVNKLKQHSDLLVFGSGALIRSLIGQDVIDEFVLMVHPLVLGAGVRLFDDRTPMTGLRLIESTPSSTGVLLTRYAPAGH